MRTLEERVADIEQAVIDLLDRPVLVTNEQIERFAAFRKRVAAERRVRAGDDTETDDGQESADR